MNLFFPLRVALVNRGPDLELFVANPVELSGKGRPLVLHDITLALKMLQIRIFLVWLFIQLFSFLFGIIFVSKF